MLTFFHPPRTSQQSTSNCQMECLFTLFAQLSFTFPLSRLLFLYMFSLIMTSPHPCLALVNSATTAVTPRSQTNFSLLPTTMSFSAPAPNSPPIHCGMSHYLLFTRITYPNLYVLLPIYLLSRASILLLLQLSPFPPTNNSYSLYMLPSAVLSCLRFLPLPKQAISLHGRDSPLP